MSPAHVLEPTYYSLKQKLMEGAWSPGERLEALRLADEFGVSMTPVRDCLNRLVGEQLVAMKPGDGYRVPYMSEQTLRDMLEVNETLLDQALRSANPDILHLRAKQTFTDHAGRTAALFETIASQGANRVITEIVQSLGERMHAIRNLDPHVFPDAREEIDEMARLATSGDSGLRHKLEAYHDRRRQVASVLIQMLR